MNLQRKEIKAILDFMDAFGADVVGISTDNNLGIGGLIKARINSVMVKDMEVDVECIVSDAKDW